MILLWILLYLVVGFLAGILYLKYFHHTFGKNIIDNDPNVNALFVMAMWPIMCSVLVLVTMTTGMLKVFAKINKYLTPKRHLTAIEHIAEAIDDKPVIKIR